MMGSIFRRYPSLLALAVVGAVLAALVAWEISAGVGASPPLASRPVRRAAPFEAKLLPPPPVVQAEQQYAEFAARPLWTPTRRPAPAAAPPSTYTPGQFVLQGVIVAGGSKTAMLREKSNGHLHRVEAGKQLNGVTVADISPESVTLTQGTDREVLPLQVQKGPAPPATPGGPGHPAVPAPPPAQFGPPLPPALQPHPAPAPVPGAPAGAPSAGFFGGQNPIATPAAPPANGAPAPQATPSSAPLSAEELLARRRARRGQQTQ